ncbi:MAG: hypothetical protein NVV74_18365 [Magnetospirillum sp.]|nr:hypothetical protein [Magnetospirillum sp.]
MAALAALSALPVHAADLHQLWDRQCGGCHGHASAFARERLAVVGGQLRDRAGNRDVAAFLVAHGGGYSAADIAAIVEMLKVQVATPDLFRQRCGECHQTAAQLVREQVVSRDGVLHGRYSGRPIAAFLTGHGGLTPEENALMISVLQRIEREVHRP